MKKIISTLFLALMLAPLFSQHVLSVSGAVSNNAGQPIMVILDFNDSLLRQIDTVWTDSLGFYQDSLTVPLGNPSNLAYAVASIIDCNGNAIYSSTTYSGNISAITLNLNYCGSNPPGPCQAMFTKYQAKDSLRNPIPGHVIITDMSSGSNLQYFWDFGDSTSSTLKNPQHTYTGNGPYVLCLTVSDSNCTDTYCDTLTVDSNGVVLRRSPGFTIHVGGFALGIDDASDIKFSIMPNPVNDFINIQFDNAESRSIQMGIINVGGKEEYMERRNIQSGEKIQIDVSRLNSGMYILLLQSEGDVYTKRFIKM